MGYSEFKCNVSTQPLYHLITQQINSSSILGHQAASTPGQSHWRPRPVHRSHVVYVENHRPESPAHARYSPGSRARHCLPARQGRSFCFFCRKSLPRLHNNWETAMSRPCRYDRPASGSYPRHRHTSPGRDNGDR